MTLELDVVVQLGTLDMSVRLDAPAGAITAVLGPNGAGKTTLLQCVAGSIGIDAGSIVLDGQTLDAPPRTFVVPEKRRLGVVHQESLLFPHLTAVDNVAFGIRCAGTGKREARRRAHELIDAVGLSDHAHARPPALSGGQAQRVALARALAVEPAALLLDEPLGALDAGTRIAVRRELRRHLASITGPTLLVTHDPIDMLALADHVAVIERGHLTQSGTIAEVTSRPRSRYVADLIGTNLVSGTASTTKPDGQSAGGSARLTTVTTETGATLTVADRACGKVLATIPPAAVALFSAEPGGSPRNRWPMTVEHIERLGGRTRVHLVGPLRLVAEVTPAAAAELDLREGAPVWASVKATEIGTYPA